MRWLDRTLELLAMLGVAAYGVAAIVTVADVVGRRFGLPVAGVVDIVQLCVTAGAWFVIPWAFVTGAHVGVEFVTAQLPGRLERALRIVAALMAGGLVALMLRFGWDAYVLQDRLGDRSQQLGIPIAWYWWPLLAGQAAALLALVSVIVHLLRGRAPGPEGGP